MSSTTVETAPIVYPDSDGMPMADNTQQFRAIVTIQGNLDALVDLTIEQPETPRLWLRRWLEQDESPAAIEAEVSLPLYDMALDLLERAQAAGTIRSSGVDLRMMLTGFIWILYGYFAGSPLDASGARVDPLHPEQIAAFKRFLHAYTARMLGLPEERGQESTE